MKPRLILAVSSVLMLLAASPAFAIIGGQTDEFEDGTVMNWAEGAPSQNPPTNVADGGPAGTGDNYLRNLSNGGIGGGSRQVMFNTVQWTGDYGTEEIIKIEADMNNFGGTSLSMRVALQGAGGTWYASTIAVVLPAGSGWQKVEFSLAGADLTQVFGTATLDAVLADVTELRILSASAGPNFRGDSIVSDLGVDNVTAVDASVPVADSTWGAVKALYE